MVGRDATIISRRISRLEKKLGVRLLSRTTSKVALTEVGNQYYQRVRRILEDLSSAGEEASDLASKPQGLLRISVPVTFGRQWVAPALPGFLAKHPQIRVDAAFSDRFVDLVAEGFDVVIRLGALKDSTNTATWIAPSETALFASPGYLRAHGVPSHPEDLSSHACLGFTSHASWPEWILVSKDSQRAIKPSGPMTADNSEALLAAAIEGLGIVLTPDWLAGPAVKSGSLVRILQGWQGVANGGIHAVMPPGRLVPAKTRVFVEHISTTIRTAWSRDLS